MIGATFGVLVSAAPLFVEVHTMYRSNEHMAKLYALLWPSVLAVAMLFSSLEYVLADIVLSDGKVWLFPTSLQHCQRYWVIKIDQS